MSVTEAGAAPPGAENGVTEHQVLRGEPFSGEHLQHHARNLAAALRIAAPVEDRKFAARFEENASFIRAAYEVVSAAVREGEPLTPEAEWLLDNFYVVEDQLLEIRDDLPQKFYRELPKLATGKPRVYALSLELIVHTDSALDEDTIIRFVNAFQTVAPLSIGEVWAVPIMLRLALLENLRRLAGQMLAARRCQAEARQLIAAWREHEEFPLDLSSLEACAPLVLQLLEQMHEQGALATAGLKRLDEQLTKHQFSVHEIARLEHQRQAANQVSIGNVITSMRLISALDWVVIFEQINLAEQTLRQDPAEVYPQMDFASRDRYRHVVEELAKRTRLTDVEVAQQAIALAQNAQAVQSAAWQCRHVGYWLGDRGREELERKLGYRPRSANWLKRRLMKNPSAAYFGSVATSTFLAVGALALTSWMSGLPVAAIVLIACLALLPASEMAVNLTNLLVTSLLPPRLLPKLEFKDGVTATYSTFVVIPSLLTSRRDVETLLSRLEMHYLANAESALRFALLTDLADAEVKEQPGDEELVAFARQGIRNLNATYSNDGHQPFFLFHRERRWNEAEGCWMGWERKRGKLLEFNRLLRGSTDTSYVVQEGDVSFLRQRRAVQFVITLDADTQLPHGAARRLIGTLAHPLNRPHFDAKTGRIVAGYSVLQPRVTIPLASANRTWFSKIFANSPGLDPYTTAASDVYQDLFGEGSFTGKGIYDLDAFEKTLDGAFPENQILSHDLIEGCHGRVALVSDIEVIDGYPSRYDAAARREHRWIRGDWQILPWLLPRVPSAHGWRPNQLSLLSRWKIFDNLRRSLVPPTLLAALLVGWLAWPNAAWIWTLAALLMLFLPLLSQLALAVRYWPRGTARPYHFHALAIDLGRSLIQTAINISVLPYEAVLMLDAIGRTLFRMIVTRRKLLEWETAEATERRLRHSRWSSFVQMWFVPVLAIVLAVALAPAARLAALPFLTAWLLAPPIAHWISQPRRVQAANLSVSQNSWLRLIARKTWAFYEACVGPEDNWLPPDNLQEYPTEKIAHRVSPTNEGLFLASALAARDFGYIGLTDLADLWERSLDSLKGLDRLHGHFYNWYDTLTLKPLFPRYVSTVDSGNLAACLLTVGQGITDLRTASIMPADLWRGLADTIAMAEECCERLHPRGARLVSPPLNELADAIALLRNYATSAPQDLFQWQAALERLAQDARQVSQRLETFQKTAEFPDTEVVPKVRSLLLWVAGVQKDWQALFPWVGVALELTRESPGTAPRALPWNGASSAAQAKWQDLWKALSDRRSLVAVTTLEHAAAPSISGLRDQLASDLAGENREAALSWLEKLQSAASLATRSAIALSHRFDSLARQMDSLAQEMDFRFLYNPQRRLFAIGFNVEEAKLDRAHYDLLCSEARVASYLAIAKGDVEPRHWFQLGRPLTQTAGQPALLSWGGTMFEYLMPPIFQRIYEGSLLSQSCQAAVARQQQYGRQNKVPWGTSESAFGALAINSDYHYRSFGVPGLGLKRGLAKDLVVSPYSTMLALETDPPAAFDNLQALAQEGALGAWGFYDAIDYTPQRLAVGKRSIIVRCYMAHHQGMSLLAIANLLFGGCIRRRFHAHPLARANELLLQEKIPIAAPRVEPHADELSLVEVPRFDEELVSRRLTGVETPVPRTHLLANGEYSVMLSSTGGGYIRWRDIAVTRWRPDTTRDPWGQFIYLRDATTGQTWSAMYQPTCIAPDHYEVVYSIDKAEFHRRDGSLETHLEVAVSPENNAEVRQLKLTNHGSQTRRIEITSYVEIALCTQPADLAHPAFQKLFVETEYIAEESALLARRRPRDARQQPLWAVHALACGEDVANTIQYETSRQAFLGRGKTHERPAALDSGARLTGQVGAVLDPIFALRCTVTVRPNDSVTVGLTTALATSREEALILADQYHDARGVQRAFELAWAYNQVQLRHLHLSPAKAHLYQRVASAVLYPDAARRGASESMLANRLGQNGLWRHGISGDLPIVLIHVTKPEHLNHIRELLTAHAYWQSRGLAVDLVILNDFPGSYFDALQEQIVTLLNETPRTAAEPKAGVFLLRGAQLQRDDKALLEAAASVALYGERGTIGQQWDAASTAQSKEFAAAQRQTVARQIRPSTSNRLAPLRPAMQEADGNRTREIQRLEFWNGTGGFAQDGREYRILLAAGKSTPMPWSNVIASPTFGTLITESGGGFTWHLNSRENKLSTWSNDPISDPPAEVIYVRDEQSGELWSPLPAVRRDAGDYWIHHGQGYTRFLHHAAGIEHDLLLSIAPDDPVKFIRLKLCNTTSSPRELSVTYFVEWVLGVCREQTQLHARTEVDRATGALLARNAYHPDLPEQVAFLQVLGNNRSRTGDRREFIGRCGDFNRPEGVSRSQLSGRTGPGLDPCGAMQTKVRLPPQGETEVIFLLGAGSDLARAQTLLNKYIDAAAVHRACDETAARWDAILGALRVKTPNRALDLLVNRWLLYQALSCRVWGRSALYQSGGAYGFRDQLQDVMALVYSRPDLAREHLLRAAGRQYEEGDVQHWWHPPEGRGTRTRFSDDYLWLPFATAHYLNVTGDSGVLNEEVPFLQSPPLEPHEQERYETPAVATTSATLYEHCRRAVVRGLRTGPHGLPLMGCGDWNDGMNRVGELGQGESVWVGWFLLVLLRDFLPLMHSRGDGPAAQEFQGRADAIRHALEQHAWDGQWYRRAYFDDGTPLGSAQNDECQIDSIAQSWAVFAGASPDRCQQAISAVCDRLVKWDDRLVLLFTPPFNQTMLDPGYIKGYLPGIRENGGQYTHPALWLIQALAKMGAADDAARILDLINPIHHAHTSQDVARYQVEPYVVAADVYGVPPQTGRGGWTWYTGSAAWMYRAVVESLLGLTLRGNRLAVSPCVPDSWPGFEVTFRRGDTAWKLDVRRGDKESAELTELELVEDGQIHEHTIRYSKKS